MGSKVSVVHGVKSDHFYEQGNGINEIWAGDVEIISRLPFGDSDQEQSGWLAGGVPKIPWHQFIIPLRKRDDGNMTMQDIVGRATSSKRLIEEWIPTSGYLGMYTYIPPAVAGVLGAIMLGAAGGIFWLQVSTLCNTPSRKKLFSQPVLPGSDAAVARRLIRSRYLTSMWKRLTWLSLSSVLVSLGLPASAASVRGMSGYYVVLNHGYILCVVFLLPTLMWIVYLMFVWWPKPEEWEVVEMESQNPEPGLDTIDDQQK